MKQQLREMQENDPDIKFIQNRKLETDEKPPKSEIEGKSQNTKIIWGLWNSLVTHNNVLYKHFCKDNAREIFQYSSKRD